MQDEETIKYYIQHALGEKDTFQFTCKQCGACCRNRHEPIMVSGPDIYYMAKELDITPIEAVVKYTRGYIGADSRLPVLVLEERADGSCRLLKNGKCSIQKAKPAVCAIYPLGRLIKGDDDHYTYFTQPNDCPGASGEEHTVSEWVSEFHLEERDPPSVAWSAMILKLSLFMRKNKGDEKQVKRYRECCMNAMYLHYDVTQPYMPQLMENQRMLMKAMNGIKF